MTDLEQLLERVKDGRGPLLTVYGGFKNIEHYWIAREAYNGSMDAAIALMKAVLPGWVWALSSIGNREEDPRPIAMIFDGAKKNIKDGEEIMAQADTPAHALLIAILQALIAKGGEK